MGEGSFQNSLTQFVGTPGFAPPEQQALRPTYASDIYALGITSLFLLTGKTPIEFDTDPKTGDILWQHLVEVSDHFANVLHKMLKPDVMDRYQTAEEVMQVLQLEQHIDQLSVGLSHQPRPHASNGLDTVVPIDGYLTPVQRQAIGIRRWRSRKRKQSARTLINTGLSMTTSTASPHHQF